MLRKHLRRTLPDYMVPQFFKQMDRLPITSSGKVDRRHLPSPFTGDNRNDDARPRTPAEAVMADVWREVLGVDQVSVYDNFFAIGGHSLLAMRAIARIADRTGVRLTPHNLLFNTLEQLAPLCQPSASKDPAAPPRKRGWSRLLGRLTGRQ